MEARRGALQTPVGARPTSGGSQKLLLAQKVLAIAKSPAIAVAVSWGTDLDRLGMK